MLQVLLINKDVLNQNFWTNLLCHLYILIFSIRNFQNKQIIFVRTLGFAEVYNTENRTYGVNNWTNKVGKHIYTKRITTDKQNVSC